MKKSIELLKKGFETASSNTEEVKKFYRIFIKEFSDKLKEKGCIDITFIKGHFHISGLFTFKGQPYYFCIININHYSQNHFMKGLLYRTAKHYKNFSGGPNQYVDMTENLVSKMNLEAGQLSINTKIELIQEIILKYVNYPKISNKSIRNLLTESDITNFYKEEFNLHFLDNTFIELYNILITEKKTLDDNLSLDILSELQKNLFLMKHVK